MDPLVEVKRVLSSLWEEADLRGRPWGLKKEGDNPFYGSNVLIVIGDELVTVSKPRGENEIRIHQFRRVKQTSLGEEVTTALKTAALGVKVVVVSLEED